jgi:uncharacterized protein GlcG (DUF336 family)
MKLLRPVSKVLLLFGFAVLLCGLATDAWAAGRCQGLPTEAQLKALLGSAPGAGGDAGGLFHGNRMWGAVVDRDGELCAITTTTGDPTQVWPGSRHIAMHKAHTGNGFSLDTLALSTAQLYTFVQSGHSLFGLNTSNLFDTKCLGAPGSNKGINQICAGIITFGGGLGLYNSSGRIVGGIGISGDTACTDHEIAKRVRDLAGLNPPGGPLVDDITYSSTDGPSVFTHPLCLNTWRNGVFVGNELPAAGY